MTLALRTLPRGNGPAPRALLLDALHSRVARAISHPLFTMPLHIGSLYGVYFTTLFDTLMSSPIGDQFMLTHFTVAGLLFFGPILAQDPWPGTAGHGGRIVQLLLPLPFHAFFGVSIMMAGSLLVETYADPPTAWGVDPLADQSPAGGIAWAFGELPTVLVLAVVFFARALRGTPRTTARPDGRPHRRRRAQCLQRPAPGHGTVRELAMDRPRDSTVLELRTPGVGQVSEC